MNKSWIFNNLIPSVIWALFNLGLASWQFNFFGLLIVARALVVFSCLMIREKPLQRGSKIQSAVAWFSTILPTSMVWEPNRSNFGMIGEVIAITGMAIFIWTCIDLGKSFGISPAVRSRAERGIYHYVQNPMYASHVIVELGILIASPTSWNLAITLVAWALYLVRASWEKQLWEKHCRERT